MILNTAWVQKVKMMNKDIVEWIGNIKILDNKKTAFLCSVKYSATSVLKSYDWANEQKRKGKCVISGFHSALEKDVFNILLQGRQPIIMVLARGMIKRVNEVLKKALNEDRLLIITPFKRTVTYVTKDTSVHRNKLILNLADRVVVGHMSRGGKLEEILNEYHDKEVVYL